MIKWMRDIVIDCEAMRNIDRRYSSVGCIPGEMEAGMLAKHDAIRGRLICDPKRRPVLAFLERPDLLPKSCWIACGYGPGAVFHHSIMLSCGARNLVPSLLWEDLYSDDNSIVVQYTTQYGNWDAWVNANPEWKRVGKDNALEIRFRKQVSLGIQKCCLVTMPHSHHKVAWDTWFVVESCSSTREGEDSLNIDAVVRSSGILYPGSSMTGIFGANNS